MSLKPGLRIGNYEVLSPVGAGGMGEVYRGRDTRLDRTVAIKALPKAFSGDSERLARFEREARLLASLNHPHIAGIFGIEDGDGGGPYLVLEFVEGETLDQRLARGAMGVRETLKTCAQIASAIEAAHERGIVHRDLKPGNVMLTGSGGVKVLDFGLAKEDVPVESGPDLAASPTLEAPTGTADGIVLGTAPYMSPEQARGKPVDKRADVWAFGCIVMECLTGRQVFAGETVSDVIARILEREPDLDLLPPGTPRRLRDIVRRCLIKDMNRRPRDIGDLGREMEAMASETGTSSREDRDKDSVPSLAVLYFENLARDPDSEYFCSGITEDILTDLSKIAGLRVASKNAVSRYRGEDIDIAKVGRDLGVKAILEGSVRRAGDRIRITTQLINAEDGFQLWAERFDRTLDDVFAVQDEIARAIVDALRVAMSPSDVQKIAKDRPKDVRAYDLYLKGREEYGRYTRESMQKALDLFHEAIAIDPNYALAWAGIADSHGQLVQQGWTKDRTEDQRLGLEAAERSISSDPKLPDGYKAKALVLMSAGDSAGARDALTKAIQADPTYTPALINLGVLNFAAADVAGTERMLRRAMEIDPQEAFAPMWLGMLLTWTDRFDEALVMAERIRELSEEPVYVTGSYLLRIQVACQQGDVEKAKELLEAARKEKEYPGLLDPPRAYVAILDERVEEGRQLLSTPPISNNPISSAFYVGGAFRIGQPELAEKAMDLATRSFLSVVARLDLKMHPLLDRKLLAPRRCDQTLVWPLQAPMIDETRFSLFKRVVVESARSTGSNILGSSPAVD